MYFEKTSPINRIYWYPFMSLGTYAISREINCIGALGINIGVSAAFGGRVSHFVCWHVSQPRVNCRM